MSQPASVLSNYPIALRSPNIPLAVRDLLAPSVRHFVWVIAPQALVSRPLTEWKGGNVLGTANQVSGSIQGGKAPYPMTNVRNLSLPQWRRLADRPENRCVVPLTEFCEFTPQKHDLGDGKPPLKGEMWFSVTDQPVFAVAGFWQGTGEGNGFTMVTCNANSLVEPTHPKAMVTILDPDDIDI